MYIKIVYSLYIIKHTYWLYITSLWSQPQPWLRVLKTKNYTTLLPLRHSKALWVGYQRPCPIKPHTDCLHARAWGSLSYTCSCKKIRFSDMMAARFLRRSLPALRQARSYAEAVSGAPQMSFTFASPTQVTLAWLQLSARLLGPS